MSENPLAELADAGMHRIPGMPGHTEAERLNNQGGFANRPVQNLPLQNRPARSPKINHPDREPKLLVGWQHRIARWLGMESK